VTIYNDGLKNMVESADSSVVKRISFNTEQRLLKGSKSAASEQNIGNNNNPSDDKKLCSLKELGNPD
jgi:hypothetical protein